MVCGTQLSKRRCLVGGSSVATAKILPFRRSKGRKPEPRYLDLSDAFLEVDYLDWLDGIRGFLAVCLKQKYEREPYSMHRRIEEYNKRAQKQGGLGISHTTLENFSKGVTSPHSRTLWIVACMLRIKLVPMLIDDGMILDLDDFKDEAPTRRKKPRTTRRSAQGKKNTRKRR
jgi:hypothetical protein